MKRVESCTSKLVDGQNVRMIESGDCSGFADEALHPFRISRDFGRQEFDRHGAIQLARILRKVHLAHPTRRRYAHGFHWPSFIPSDSGIRETAVMLGRVYSGCMQDV